MTRVEDLPRRTPGRTGTLPPPRTLPPSLAGNPALPYPAIGQELSALRLQIPGVHGCVLGGVDGLLITHNLQNDASPDDLAALAATMFGLGRQVGSRLGQGDFQQSTVRNESGYLSVYAVSKQALLAVVGTDSINVARLHLHAPTTAARLAELLDGVTPTAP
ncbi:roadblock/LC7 domain-containing protein [Micromonospora sp. WMMD1128]|uniref:roadblock/LC7 domain-containing protein n=1 Tax=unclassified Micromonospora TaxID=2617518 RepID=UPI00248B63A3|nr:MULTISPECIES: roadblock/LC7 domain-containing protein [unclassified Micromonospora]WBB75172.1 roadblock/LC7 domain-containing protein [Micromonospora sp. WMMD1128]WFE31437.1 roadblock/LC7 domain-containing protein [Micromonospora sp. WMMD975]